MKYENAYFTVEAAMIFPLVMSVILFVVYLLMFQYDRCLLEQDLGALAIWGSSVGVADEEELEEMTRQRIAGIYWDKYVAWELTGLEASLEKNCFGVHGAGQLVFPVPGWNFWNTENLWSIEVSCGYERLSPVEFIRFCRRFAEGAKE